MKVKFRKLYDDIKLPEYKTNGSAGFDLESIEDVELKPFERKLVGTGLQLAYLEDGYEIQIRSRSGLTLKQGLIVLNTPGTIDSDYRGEIKVILYNTNRDVTIKVNKGDRIAQAIVNKIEKCELEFTENIDETERSSGGFGSTGV